MILTMRHSGKSKPTKTVKRSVVAAWGTGGIGATRRILGSKTVCDTVMVETLIIKLSKTIQCTTPAGNSYVNYEL